MKGSTRSASPDHATRCCHSGCRSPTPLARRRWRNGPFDHGITAALRRERCGPAVTRTRRTPCEIRCDRDPSMEGVQPSCQRSAPGLRVDSRARCRPSSVGVAVHAASPASTQRAPSAPAFSSGRASARRASGAPGPSAEGRPTGNGHRGGPTPLACARRVNGERELADEEHLSPAKSTRGCPARALPHEPRCLFADWPRPFG